jgi:selenocysteine lyase/cysteine desulfurase
MTRRYVMKEDPGGEHAKLAAIRQLFPITDRCAYLANGSVGPLSLRARAAVEECIVDLQNNGMRGYRRTGAARRAKWYDRREEVRGLAARLIGADPSEVAFTLNTSQGLLIVSNGIPWRDGDNIISAEGEYPGNVYPWLSLGRLGVETKFAPSRDERIAVEDVVGLIDDRTRLVALSFVGYWTGFRHDLSAIGEVCRRRGVYFCVDAIQGLGALPLDVKESKIDFLSAGGHKWLLSPFGVGIFYCRKDLLDEIIPALANCHRTVGGDYYKAPLSANVDRFEAGRVDACGVHGLGENLETFFEVGVDWIEERIRVLTDRLIEGLRVRGYDILSPVASWGERSGIVTFDHREHDSADLYRLLTEANVVVSHKSVSLWEGLSEPGIKAAPHFYNVEDDVDRLLEALP